MKRSLSILAVCFIVITAVCAQASTYEFKDSNPTVIYWPDFPASAANNRHNQNGTDVIGDPQITSGTFNFSGHSLQSVALNYTSTSNVLVPADWFFDFNNDSQWDYVFHNSNTNYKNADTYRIYDISGLHMSIDGSTVFTVNGASIEKIVAAPSDGTDTMGKSTVHGGYDYSQWPGGYYGRYDHPVRIDDRLLDPRNAIAIKDQTVTTSLMSPVHLIGSISFNGWDDTINKSTGFNTAIWDLGLLGLNLDKYSGKTFTYAYAMLCANDVVYGAAPVPSPEPGTMLLMAAGGLGVILLHRRVKRARL